MFTNFFSQVFTYRYFIENWPELCILAVTIDEATKKETIIGCIVSKCEQHMSNFYPTMRGYIGMIAVDISARGRGIAKKLVHLTMRKMREMNAHECILETELSNVGAIGLYESVGFVRHKRLPRYYLNGSDAFRYKYVFTEASYIDELKVNEEIMLRKTMGMALENYTKQLELEQKAAEVVV